MTTNQSSNISYLQNNIDHCGKENEEVRPEEHRTIRLAKLFSVFNGPFDLASGFTSLEGLSAIVELLPLGQSKLHLRTASLVEVQTERDKRQPFLLCFAEQLVDLFLVQKQLSHPHRIVIHHIAVAIGADVAMV